MTHIAVTGMGVVCATGRDQDKFEASIRDGVCGIRPIANVETGWLPVRIAGEIADLDAVAELDLPPAMYTRADALAIHAANEAIRQANLDLGAYASRRVGISLGSCQGNIARIVEVARQPGVGMRAGSSADALGVYFGARGPRVVISNACAAGAAAIAVAAEHLRQGRVDVVLAGGTDELAFFTLAGFSVLQSLDQEPCAPYSRSGGLTVGEGAGVLVLERLEDAEARGARPLARVLGYGMSADGYHPTAPDPTGRGGALAMRRALANAGLSPDDVDYVNGHGTGTVANDSMERKALRAVFGPRAATVPMSSTKSMIGHLLGAAGAVEAITCILAIRNSMLPPTANVPDGVEVDFDCVPNVSRPAPVRVTLSNNYAFGGSNASVVIGAASVEASPPPVPERDVVVTGVGCIGAAGVGVEEWFARFAEGRTTLEPLPEEFTGGATSWGARAPVVDARPFASPAAWRKMDELGRLSVASSRLAWDHAGLDLSQKERDEVGVILATASGSLEISIRFEESARQGKGAANAKDFPHTSTNSAAGHMCTVLGLHGPMLSISNGGSASITALSFASDLILRGECDVVLVTGTEELSRSIVGLGPAIGIPQSETMPRPFDAGSGGAGMGSASVTLVLEAADHAAARGRAPLAQVLGTSMVTTARPDGEIDVETWLDALETVLETTGVEGSAVGFYAAAANGVPARDRVEASAVAKVLGSECWVSAPKAVTGECLGAAGLVNVVAAIQALTTGELPTTANIEAPVDEGLLRHVTERTEAPGLEYAIASSAAFSSGVACALLARPR